MTLFQAYMIGLVMGISLASLGYVFYPVAEVWFRMARNPLMRDPQYLELTRQIEAARKAHKPVAGLITARQALVHNLLAGRAS